MGEPCSSAGGRRPSEQQRLLGRGLRGTLPKPGDPAEVAPHAAPAAVVLRGTLFDAEHERARAAEQEQTTTVQTRTVQTRRREVYQAEKLLAQARGRLAGALEREERRP